MWNEIWNNIVNGIHTMRVLELIAVITATLYIILAARRNILCFIFGFISSSIYVYICYEVTYYQDMLIQAFYVVMSVVGWLMWKKNRINAVEIIPVHVSWKHMWWYLGIGTIMTFLSGYLFSRYTDNALPYGDAFTTAFALVATWMGAKRHPEHWLIFVVVDAVAIYMYLVKDMYLTSALYVIYVIIATAAYFSWVKKIRNASGK